MFNRSSFLYRFLLAGDESCREKRGRESTVGRVEASKGRAEKGRGCAQTCFMDEERIRMLRFRGPIRKKKFDCELLIRRQRPLNSIRHFLNFFFGICLGVRLSQRLCLYTCLTCRRFLIFLQLGKSRYSHTETSLVTIYLQLIRFNEQEVLLRITSPMTSCSSWLAFIWWHYRITASCRAMFDWRWIFIPSYLSSERVSTSCCFKIARDVSQM